MLYLYHCSLPFRGQRCALLHSIVHSEGSSTETQARPAATRTGNQGKSGSARSGYSHRSRRVRRFIKISGAFISGLMSPAPQVTAAVKIWRGRTGFDRRRRSRGEEVLSRRRAAQAAGCVGGRAAPRAGGGRDSKCTGHVTGGAQGRGRRAGCRGTASPRFSRWRRRGARPGTGCRAEGQRTSRARASGDDGVCGGGRKGSAFRRGPPCGCRRSPADITSRPMDCARLDAGGRPDERRGWWVRSQNM
jgi:hypothetical protein